jgi:hypothetical protein
VSVVARRSVRVIRQMHTCTHIALTAPNAQGM